MKRVKPTMGAGPVPDSNLPFVAFGPGSRGDHRSRPGHSQAARPTVGPISNAKSPSHHQAPPKSSSGRRGLVPVQHQRGCAPAKSGSEKRADPVPDRSRDTPITSTPTETRFGARRKEAAARTTAGG